VKYEVWQSDARHRPYHTSHHDYWKHDDGQVVIYEYRLLFWVLMVKKKEKTDN